MNLLIVDDTLTDLKLLRAQLEAEGHAVFEAHDGVDALALLERQRVDGVISDILMPRMDGYRLCYEIRKHARLHDLPVIIYTSTYTSPSDETLALDVGANKYLKKPASVETIITALHEVIAQPHAAPRPEALQEIDVLREYSERLVCKLEEKNTELMVAETKFRALVEYSIVGIYIIQDDQFVYVNPGMTKIFGRSEAEMTSRPSFDFIVPEDRALARENIRKRISGGVPSVHYSLRVLHQSGAVLQVEVHGSRTDYNGRPAVMGMLVDITERKRAEEAAQRSEKRLRDIIDGLGPSMFVGLMTPQGILIEANRPALAAAGLKPEDVLGKPFEETYWWAYSQEVQQQLGEAIARAARGEASRYDVQVRAAENHLIDVDFSLQPLRDETGEVVFLVPSASVITERKLAENALRASEEKFRGLFESSRDAIMTAEPPSWGFTSGNPAFVKMFRAKNAEEFVSLGPWELSPERQPDGRASAEQAREMIETAMREGSHSFEWMHRRIGGEEFPANVLLTRMEQGGKVMLQATVRDITERKLAEESQRLQSAALHAAADAISITDRAGVIEWVNPAFTQLTGYTAVEALGKNLWDLVKSGKPAPAFYRELWETIRAGRTWHGEMINRRKDGRLYTENQAVTPILDASGAITHFVAIKQDITERLQLEAQFHQAQKMESVGQLASGIAHDFNNLLTVINGMAELIVEQVSHDDPVHADAQEIRHAGERAATLTRQLLAFSRQQILEARVLNVNTVVAGLESLLRRLLGEDIDLVVVPTPGVGSVKADPGQIEQVITNLAVNARDAMPQGGRLTIETQNVTLDEDDARQHGLAVPPGSYVRLAVSDSGVGMDEATRARIFEPFFTTKGPGKGTGLGLSTVYGIVKQSHGFIWVDSEVGQGTSFTIYLPQVIEAARTDRPEPTVVSSSGTETILLAEDNAGLRKLATRVLEPAGYTVLLASTGEEALQLLERHEKPVHVLLSDMVMPGMSGRQLAERLAQTHPEIKVLYMSGYTDDTIMRHGVLEAQVPFLNKPFTAAALLQKIREVLDS